MEKIAKEIKPVVVDVVCNRCAKSCTTVHDIREFAELKANWGYGSSQDGESQESHLCETCHKEIVSTFKIPPTTTRSVMGVA